MIIMSAKMLFITNEKARNDVINTVKKTLEKNPVKIFTVSGKGTCGKTTFEKMVCQYAKKTGLNSHITSMVKFTKIFAQRHCKWDGGKTDIERRFLSDLKDTFTRYCEFDRMNIATEIGENAKAGCDLIFIDAREPDDMLWLKENFGAERILIERPELNNRVYGNHADDDIMKWEYDIHMVNNGSLEDLDNTAKEFVERYLK